MAAQVAAAEEAAEEVEAFKQAAQNPRATSLARRLHGVPGQQRRGSGVQADNGWAFSSQNLIRTASDNGPGYDAAFRTTANKVAAASVGAATAKAANKLKNKLARPPKNVVADNGWATTSYTPSTYERQINPYGTAYNAPH